MFMYIITLVFLLYFLITFKLTTYVAQNSFLVFWSIINTYFKPHWFLKFIFLQLGGLPPFFFFFIKFNFLIVNLGNLIFYLQFLIFFNIVISSFFYIKFFFLKNITLSHWELEKFSKHYSLTDMLGKNSIRKIYNFIFIFYLFVFFNLFSVIFYTDFYIFFSVFF